MWLEIRDCLNIPNATWLAYFELHISAWEFEEMLNYWVVPYLVDHTSFPLISKWIWFVKGPFHMIIHGFSGASLPPIVILQNTKGLFCVPIFLLKIPHLSCFKILDENATLPSKFCPWNFYNQHWVKCTHNPIMSLGCWGLRVKIWGLGWMYPWVKFELVRWQSIKEGAPLYLY